MTIDSIGSAIFDGLKLEKIGCLFVQVFTDVCKGYLVATLGRKIGFAVACVPKHDLQTPFIESVSAR